MGDCKSVNSNLSIYLSIYLSILLPLSSSPLWLGVVVIFRVLCKCKIELFNHLLRIIVKPYSCMHISIGRIQLMGHTSAGHDVSGTDLVRYVSSGYISSFKGPFPQVLTLFGEVWFIAWRLRCPFLGECRRGLRYFWKCWARSDYGPAPGPTLKKALCHTLPVGGSSDKYHCAHIVCI